MVVGNRSEQKKNDVHLINDGASDGFFTARVPCSMLWARLRCASTDIHRLSRSSREWVVVRPNEKDDLSRRSPRRQVLELPGQLTKDFLYHVQSAPLPFQPVTLTAANEACCI